MYVAGDDGNGDLDDLRPARRQHLLRRHLSGADLGRLHADAMEDQPVKDFDGAGVRQPRRSDAQPTPRPDRRRETTTEAPTEEPTETDGARRPSRRAGADDRGAEPGAARDRAASRPSRPAAETDEGPGTAREPSKPTPIAEAAPSGEPDRRRPG